MIRNPSVLKPAVPETKSNPAPADERKAVERRPESHSAPEPQKSPEPIAPLRMAQVAWAIVLLLVAVGAGAGWYFRAEWWPRVAAYFPEKAVAPKGPRVVPVVTAKATKRNLDLYLNGLGTVVALKTVTIRSRVEGELISVNFVEGEMVEKGKLLAEIDPRPFEVQRDQAAGQLARDEATLKAAKITLDRLNGLLKSNSVSMQEVENQQAVVQQTEGIIKSDQAMVANAELQITYCKIVSPLDGRIGLRLVDVGNIVRANDPSGLAVINQLQPIAITFTISQDEIPRVQKRIRDGGELRVDAYDRGFTTKLASGKLLAADNQVDSATGTLRLKAVIEKDASVLFPNQFVNTRLLVDTKVDSTVVPSAAVQRGPNSTFVYVVKSDDTVELRDVTIGPTEGAETSIEDGLAPGEVVVTEGLDKLQAGAKVAPRDASAKGTDGQKKGRTEVKMNESAASGK